jgi:anionic cell wall polymer biosynthesis LytR-Cps2A-Psr (LCP) family protein
MNKDIPDTAANIGGPAELITAPGLQTLNGNQAVTYARIRKDHAQGDYRRNERMKIVLSATIDKAKHTNPIKLNRIANTVLPQIKTNMSNTDMMSVMMSLVTKDMTGSAGWPFEVTGWSHGAWYGVPDTLESNVIQLHEQYFGQPGYTPTDTVEEISKNISYKTGVY